MTQYYKMPGFTLANANVSTKVLLSLFLVVVLMGLAVAILQYEDRAQFSSRGAVEWIRGNEGDLAATEIKPEKTYRELLALTHDHAFALPMLLFVLLHIVALTSIGERAKIAIYVAGFLSLVLSLAGPWLVAYAGEGFEALLRAAGFGLTATIGVSGVVSLHEIWFARLRRRRRGAPEPKAPDPMFPGRRHGG